MSNETLQNPLAQLLAGEVKRQFIVARPVASEDQVDGESVTDAVTGVESTPA
jgi:hypothetical protein